MRADVAQPGGAQERVAHRVYQHVGVGMPRQSPVEGNLHAAYDELAPGDERVRVKSLTNTHSQLPLISYQL